MKLENLMKREFYDRSIHKCRGLSHYNSLFAYPESKHRISAKACERLGMEKRAADQFKTLIEKGLSTEEIAVVLSVTLGVNVTEKQIKNWMNYVKRGCDQSADVVQFDTIRSRKRGRPVRKS